MRERLAFTLAVAVIAVHASVDAFFAPEPGTAWDDHLLRGSVTLALLVAAALSYPHLRPGARAVPAVVLGVLSLEGAVLAVYDARAVGARGEDWSGFLLGPAGLFLCGLAVALLWSSRKPGRLRYLRRAGLGVATVVGALWVVVPLAVAIGATRLGSRIPLGPCHRTVGHPCLHIWPRLRVLLRAEVHRLTVREGRS